MFKHFQNVRSLIQIYIFVALILYLFTQKCVHLKVYKNVSYYYKNCVIFNSFSFCVNFFIYFWWCAFCQPNFTSFNVLLFCMIPLSEGDFDLLILFLVYTNIRQVMHPSSLSQSLELWASQLPSSSQSCQRRETNLFQRQ